MDENTDETEMARAATLSTDMSSTDTSSTDMSSTEAWENLRAAAESASKRARAPYSGFGVGAALMGRSGIIRAGCNIENAAYTGLHAEGGAIGAWMLEENDAPTHLVVVAQAQPARADLQQEPRSGGARLTLPCGMCRQMLYEIAGGELRVLTEEGELRLDALLPHAFSGRDLG